MNGKDARDVRRPDRLILNGRILHISSEFDNLTMMMCFIYARLTANTIILSR